MFVVLIHPQHGDAESHQGYYTGKIIAAVGGHYLIQADKDELDQPERPMVLYSLEELSDCCDQCGQKYAAMYESRADMERFLAWANRPEAGKVVHLLGKPH
jgi:hypothetical protein